MAVVKIILRNEEKADGTYPLAIRITKDRKSSYIYLEHSIKPEQWDKKNQQVKKSHPNSVRLNNYLIKKLSEANDIALELAANKTVTVKAVKNQIKPATASTFFPQALDYLKLLKEAGKYNQYTPCKSQMKHFKEFIGSDIAFQDITPSLLERFKAHIITKLRLRERSAANHLVMIRSVFNHAIKSKVIDPKHYPFGKGKMKLSFRTAIRSGC
jgi:integrase/recombinase XerD